MHLLRQPLSQEAPFHRGESLLLPIVLVHSGVFMRDGRARRAASSALLSGDKFPKEEEWASVLTGALEHSARRGRERLPRYSIQVSVRTWPAKARAACLDCSDISS